MSDESDREVGPAARWFEDFAVGDRLRTQGRTVSDTDRVVWAMFTGDMNPMHVDEEFARAHGLFGAAFPPGLMHVALASGLQERLGLFTGTGLAMRSQTIVYRSPAVVGDTIHVEMEVKEVRRHSSRPRGTLTFAYTILKQDGTTVLEGDWVIEVASRDGAAATEA